MTPSITIVTSASLPCLITDPQQRDESVRRYAVEDIGTVARLEVVPISSGGLQNLSWAIAEASGGTLLEAGRRWLQTLWSLHRKNSADVGAG